MFDGRLLSTILVDELTAQHLQQHEGPNGPQPRRLGRFLPVGLTQPVQVFQLRSAGQGSEVDDRLYQNALDAFEQGDWATSRQQLEQMSSADPSKSFLMSQLENQQNQAGDFDGIIKMTRKR